MWVIHRIHHATSHLRTATTVTITTRFPQTDVSMINVADLSNGGVALPTYHSDFCRRKLQGNIITLFGDDLSGCTSSTNNLPTFAWYQFYIVNGRTQGNIFEGKALPISIGESGPEMTVAPTANLSG